MTFSPFRLRGSTNSARTLGRMLSLRTRWCKCIRANKTKLNVNVVIWKHTPTSVHRGLWVCRHRAFPAPELHSNPPNAHTQTQTINAPFGQWSINTCSQPQTDTQRLLRTFLQPTPVWTRCWAAGPSECDVSSDCFSPEATKQKSSPLLKKGIKGGYESLRSSVVCHCWLGFPNVEGKWIIAFYLLSKQRWWRLWEK